MKICRTTLILVLVACCSGVHAGDDVISEFLEKEFTTVGRLEALPTPVQDHLLRRADNGPEDCDLSGIANPTEPFNSTDVAECGLPMRRLKFGGVSESMVFVYYEHGGRGYHFHLVIYRARGGEPGVIFAGRFTRGAGEKAGWRDPATTEDLKRTVRSEMIDDETAVADAHGYW